MGEDVGVCGLRIRAFDRIDWGSSTRTVKLQWELELYSESTGESHIMCNTFSDGLTWPRPHPHAGFKYGGGTQGRRANFTLVQIRKAA